MNKQTRWAWLSEPAEHFVERARHADDMPAMKLDQRLVAAFISIMNDRYGMLPNGPSSAVDPGDENEPAGHSLALHR